MAVTDENRTDLEAWEGYTANDLIKRAGCKKASRKLKSDWVPVFVELLSTLTAVDTIIVGFAVRSALGDEPLNYYARTLGDKLGGMSRETTQRHLAGLAKKGYLIAEPRRKERSAVRDGNPVVTVQCLATAYYANVAAIAKAIGLPERPPSQEDGSVERQRKPSENVASAPKSLVSTGSAKSADAGRGQGACAGATSLGELLAGQTSQLCDERAFKRFCSAFPRSPGRKMAETRGAWDKLINAGYRPDQLAKLGEIYMGCDLGETEKPRYPIMLLKEVSRIRRLMGPPPSSLCPQSPQDAVRANPPQAAGDKDLSGCAGPQTDDAAGMPLISEATASSDGDVPFPGEDAPEDQLEAWLCNNDGD